MNKIWYITENNYLTNNNADIVYNKFCSYEPGPSGNYLFVTHNDANVYFSAKSSLFLTIKYGLLNSPGSDLLYKLRGD